MIESKKFLNILKKRINFFTGVPDSILKNFTKLIDKDMMNLAKSVNALKDILIKNGAKKEAQELGSIFVTNVGKFRKFMKIKWLKMLRNLI